MSENAAIRGRLIVKLATTIVVAGALLAGLHAALDRRHGARRPQFRVAARRAAGRADRPDAGRQQPRPRGRRLADHEPLHEQPHVGEAGPDLRRHEAGAGRHRGLPLLRAQRARRAGHRCAPWRRTWPRARCSRAARRSPSSWSSRRSCSRRRRPEERAAATAEDVARKLARGPPGAGPGGQVLEGRDPHPLPEHRVLRPGRVRHPGRRAAVLQRERRRPAAAAGRDARRAWCRAPPTTTRSPTPTTPRPGATRCCSGCTSSSTSPTQS